MRTSYKKNRPFDFKLIDLVQPNRVLYMRTGLSNYETMKAKSEIWAKIARIMGCEVDFCLMRWNNLHYQFRKEFRRASHTGSTWPYLKRLQFLADLQLRPQGKIKHKAQQQEVITAQALEPPVDHFVWDEEQQNNVIIEEIIEDAGNDQIIQEEIIYEDQEEDKQEYIYPAIDFLKIEQVLAQFKNPNRARVERRIMAFLLKCQLRSLLKESMNDLII